MLRTPCPWRKRHVMTRRRPQTFHSKQVISLWGMRLLYGFLCCALLVLASVRFYGAGHSTMGDGYWQGVHAALVVLASRTVQAPGPGTCTVLLTAAARGGR